LAEHDGGVTVGLQQLLKSPLGLEPVTFACRDADPAISWVSTTELADPSQFLRGGELVLTTGVSNRSVDQQREFVKSLISVPVAALGYAVGYVDTDIPAAVVDAAEAGGLPVFRVPLQTPFTAISHWVAEELYKERYAAVERAAEIQNQLTRVLLREAGLDPLLRTLWQLTGGSCAVYDHRGRRLARQPPDSQWSSLAELRSAAESDAGLTLSAIEIEGVDIAYLCVRDASSATPVIPYAAGLVGLELARRQAILTGRRELLGQVFEDLVHGVVAGPEVARKLSAHGIDPRKPSRILVGRVDADPDRLRRVPWSLSALLGDPSKQEATALVGDLVVTVVPTSQDHKPLARKLLQQLEGLGGRAAIGVSQPYTGVRAFLMGFHEARNAADRGAGINQSEGLNLTSLVLSNADMPIKEVARAMLQPLFEYDRDRQGALVETLKVYLNSGCSPHTAAAVLVIHRNGLQYRLRKIQELTKHDLSSFEDQVRLWLALVALGLV
jgi:purine catabolism regulator